MFKTLVLLVQLLVVRFMFIQARKKVQFTHTFSFFLSFDVLFCFFTLDINWLCVDQIVKHMRFDPPSNYVSMESQMGDKIICMLVSKVSKYFAIVGFKKCKQVST